MTAVGLSASHSFADDGRSAWIAVDRDHDSVALRVFAALENGETGTYKLVSRKSGQSGSAVSQQGGRIGQGTGSAAGPFTTSRFSLRAGEELQAELTVTTSSGRIFTHSISAVAE